MKTTDIIAALQLLNDEYANSDKIVDINVSKTRIRVLVVFKDGACDYMYYHKESGWYY